jgi:hypothetical protein
MHTKLKMALELGFAVFQIQSNGSVARNEVILQKEENTFKGENLVLSPSLRSPFQHFSI